MGSKGKIAEKILDILPASARSAGTKSPPILQANENQTLIDFLPVFKSNKSIVLTFTID